MTLFLLAALLCFALAAARATPARVDLTALGLAFLTVAAFVGSTTRF